jgi:hypothetical protein
MVYSYAPLMVHQILLPLMDGIILSQNNLIINGTIIAINGQFMGSTINGSEALALLQISVANCKIIMNTHVFRSIRLCEHAYGVCLKADVDMLSSQKGSKLSLVKTSHHIILYCSI